MCGKTACAASSAASVSGKQSGTSVVGMAGHAGHRESVWPPPAGKRKTRPVHTLPPYTHTQGHAAVTVWLLL